MFSTSLTEQLISEVAVVKSNEILGTELEGDILLHCMTLASQLAAAPCRTEFIEPCPPHRWLNDLKMHF